MALETTMDITPIKASIHYNDVTHTYHTKVSRMEQTQEGDRPWVDELGDWLTLAEAIYAILRYWASVNTNVLAAIGDLTALAANITGLIGTFAQGEPTEFGDFAPLPGTDFTAPPYDGVADNWGVITPP